MGTNKEKTDSSGTAQNSNSPARPLSGGLDPYAGPCTKTQAAHLLRRATFGPTIADIRLSASIGLKQTLQTLFVEYPQPAGPNNLDYTKDTYVPKGQTWVDQPYSATDAGVLNYRNVSLRAWLYDLILQDGISIREKLVLFWHNHFSTNEVVDPNFQYHHLNLLRTFAWGNFKELVKRMTVDPLMLRFLNGNQNTRTGKNENYARELLELFTLGEGRYGEADIKAAARAFTGWSVDRESGQFVVHPDRHDDGQKTFLGKSGRFGGDEILTILLAQPRTAEMIVEKLWREFVSPRPDPAEVARIATVLRDASYDVAPALRALLTSDAFWDRGNRGVLIKAPAVLIAGIHRDLGLPVVDPSALAVHARKLGQDLFEPPNVKGWPGGEQWINAGTLLMRRQIVERLFRLVEPAGAGTMTAAATSPRPQDEAMPTRAGRFQRAMQDVWFDDQAFGAMLRTHDQAALVRLLLADKPAHPVAAPDRLGMIRKLTLDPMYQLK